MTASDERPTWPTLEVHRAIDEVRAWLTPAAVSPATITHRIVLAPRPGRAYGGSVALQARMVLDPIDGTVIGCRAHDELLRYQQGRQLKIRGLTKTEEGRREYAIEHKGTGIVVPVTVVHTAELWAQTKEG